MAHELQLIKQSSGILIPATPETSDILQSKIKLGAVLVAEFRQVRNPAFHRRFFALLNLGFEYWEPTGGAISANERKLVNGYAKFLAAYGGNESALLDAAEQYLEQIANRRVTNGIKPLKHWIDLTQRAVNDICRETELAEGLGCIEELKEIRLAALADLRALKKLEAA